MPLGGTAVAAKENIGFSGICKTMGNNNQEEILLLKFMFVFDVGVNCYKEFLAQPC